MANAGPVRTLLNHESESDVTEMVHLDEQVARVGVVPVGQGGELGVQGVAVRGGADKAEGSVRV